LSFHAHGSTYASSEEFHEDNNGIEQDPEVNPIPTEILVVEWLQLLKRAFALKVARNHKPRVGFVLTAWDGLPVERKNDPLKFISLEMPLLSQFIQTNSSEFEFGFFGVSTAGPDISKFEDHLKSCDDVGICEHGFVYCKNDSDAFVRVNDILTPLYWAFKK
ncbi:MAG: hypothetical protein K2X81_24120, partial [Candidatus Obscuribacterales bacterium]|nr:hypothetical protein [Candidatus Obscuribacterales bacterium]